MQSLLLRDHPPNERMPRPYGLVYTDYYRHRHWIAPIPLNHLFRWALTIWMRLRNPVPPGRIDRLSMRALYQQAYRQGFRAGNVARQPPGTALVFTRPTEAMVAAAWQVHADAGQLARRVLEAAIRSGPHRRRPPEAW